VPVCVCQCVCVPVPVLVFVCCVSESVHVLCCVCEWCMPTATSSTRCGRCACSIIGDTTCGTRMLRHFIINGSNVAKRSDFPSNRTDLPCQWAHGFARNPSRSTELQTRGVYKVLLLRFQLLEEPLGTCMPEHRSSFCM
jgi:hypothetical protein